MVCWRFLGSVWRVSWECLRGVLTVSDGCLDSVRRVSWQCQKDVLSESVFTCFCLQFFYQWGKNRMGHDRAGQLMSGHVRTDCFWTQNFVAYKYFWNQSIFGTKFFCVIIFSIKSFMSRPFSFNCFSFNIVTLGFHLKFSACKMDPWSGFIMQLETTHLTHPTHWISLKSVPTCKM